MNHPLVKIFRMLSEVESRKGRFYPSRAFDKVSHQIANCKSINNNGTLVMNDGSIVGLGSSSVAVVIEYLAHGTCSRLDSEKLFNYDVDELFNSITKIAGIGEIKARRILDSDKYYSLTDFISKLPNEGDFIGNSGIRYTSMMKTGVELLNLTNGERLSWDSANDLANSIINSVDKSISHNVYKLGSLRRHKSTVGDLDLLISNYDDNNLIKLIDEYSSKLDHLFVRGSTKISGIKQGFQVDVRFIPVKYLGAHILHGTGSAKFNILMRARAKSLNCRLNEYCIIDSTGHELCFDDERDIFKYLKVKFVKPEDRSDIGYLDYY